MPLNIFSVETPERVHLYLFSCYRKSSNTEKGVLLTIFPDLTRDIRRLGGDTGAQKITNCAGLNVLIESVEKDSN